MKSAIRCTKAIHRKPSPWLPTRAQDFSLAYLLAVAAPMISSWIQDRGC